MSNFSFNNLANTTGVASDKHLRPYSINEVKFVEAKVDVLHSDKKQEDYDILKVRWENDYGYYEENVFLPGTTGSDVERTPNSWGGENPSNADRVMMFFAHTLGVLNPDGFARLKKVVGNAKNFKDVATMVAKLLNEKKGIKCYLKLTGRENQGVIYASLPYYAAISKDSGDAYVSNNFLSLTDNLTFNPNEDKKRQEFEKAKPTPVSSNTVEPTGDNSDIEGASQDELNDLLSGL